jgi:hypothetical protein
MLIASYDDSTSLVNDDRVYLLIVDFGFAAPHYDFGRAVFADIDSVKAFLEKNDGDCRSVNLKIDGIIRIIILRIDSLELPFIQTIDPEGRRSNPQCELNCVVIELRKAKVGFVVYPDDVAAAQLDFRSPISFAVKLVALVEREIQCRVEPIILRIVRPLVVDFTFYQADPGDVNGIIIRFIIGIIDRIINRVINEIIKDGIIGQANGTERRQEADHYHHHWPDIAGAATGGIISEFVKELHTILRGQNSKEPLTNFIRSIRNRFILLRSLAVPMTASNRFWLNF